MKKRGFTLVEIMIVVAIIALLAAIAIPNLLNARKSASDASAKANVKTLSTEQEVYSAGALGNGNYYASETDFKANSTAANNYCGAVKSGYTYACASSTAAYNVSATCASGATLCTPGNFTCTSGGNCNM
jgi:type IV pilus assembly protein PilA